MPDTVSKETRSRMMSGIRGKNTKPEILIRRDLHKAGFRFRLHTRGLPGKPDIVLPRYRAVILVNGCFWHGHNCHLFRWPGSRNSFWRTKIFKNKANDEKILTALDAQDWRVLVIWECALKGKEKRPVGGIIDEVSGWLHSDDTYHEIRGINV